MGQKLHEDVERLAFEGDRRASDSKLPLAFVEFDVRETPDPALTPGRAAGLIVHRIQRFANL